MPRVAIPLIAAAMLSGCGGSGGDDSQPPTTVTVSGKITFDRIPFKATGAGLNPTAPIESPARQVLVEALDASSGDAVLATTSTDTAGDYSLQVPANRNVKIRAKAQMQKTGTAPTWDFKVLNNTNSDALYALDGTASSTGTANSTRNLRATSGWGTTSYTGTRAAAPFAILDSICRAKELVLTAASGSVFPALNLYWSLNNRTGTSTSPLCPDTGDVGTTFYVAAGFNDECATSSSLPGGIYILGSFSDGAGDTDEFDQHVIAHEFGHYVEDNFSRADSIGGEHGPADRLDLRVAFGEGWGNSYSAMVLADPAYRDSFAGIASESGFNLETDNMAALEGWFSEFSAGEILWDIFDTAADAGDQVSLGFPPIFAVLTGAQKQTEALTSIFSFADALRTANSAQTAGIDALLSGESILVNDAFGTNEVNDGGSATALPIYQTILPNQPTPVLVCGSGTDANRNKLGYRRFLRLDLSAPAILTITAIGAVDPGTSESVAASDPDIFVYRQGVVVQFSEETTTQPGSMETISQKSFGAGTHIIEVFDFALSGTSSTPHCMTVSVTG